MDVIGFEWDPDKDSENFAKHDVSFSLGDGLRPLRARHQ